MKFTYCADVHLNDFASIHFDKKATKLLLYNTICISFHVQWSFNDQVFTLSIERLFLVLCRLSQEWNLSFPLVSKFLRCQALVSPSPSTLSLLGSPDGQQLLRCFQCFLCWLLVTSCGSFFSFLSSFLCVCFPVPLRISSRIPVHFARRDT